MTRVNMEVVIVVDLDCGHYNKRYVEGEGFIALDFVFNERSVIECDDGCLVVASLFVAVAIDVVAVAAVM